MRNFHNLASGVNVTPLLNQLYRHSELWNQHRIRTEHEQSPHTQCDDILLRFQSGEGMQVVDDPECIWYPAWDVLTEMHGIIFNLCRTVCAERIGRIIISRMAPGKQIAPHEDGGAVAFYYSRYQVPLQCEAGCIFECDGEKVQMRGGEVWWFDNKKTHAVVNNSAVDRISVIVDLRTR
jgi:hypothetical protein